MGRRRQRAALEVGAVQFSGIGLVFADHLEIARLAAVAPRVVHHRLGVVRGLGLPGF